MGSSISSIQDWLSDLADCSRLFDITGANSNSIRVALEQLIEPETKPSFHEFEKKEGRWISNGSLLIERVCLERGLPAVYAMSPDRGERVLTFSRLAFIPDRGIYGVAPSNNGSPYEILCIKQSSLY